MSLAHWQNTPCKEYQGYTEPNQYPRIRFRTNGKRHSIQLSRLTWQNANGPIPQGMLICHHCDNRKCYELNHLFLGTHKDNAKDCRDKQRHTLAKRTHCRNGHPYDDANTMLTTGHGYTYRVCKACRKLKRNRKTA